MIIHKESVEKNQAAAHHCRFSSIVFLSFFLSFSCLNTTNKCECVLKMQIWKMGSSFAITTATATEQLTTTDEWLAWQAYKNSFFFSLHQTISRDVHKLFSIKTYTRKMCDRERERAKKTHRHTFKHRKWQSETYQIRSSFFFSFFLSIYLTCSIKCELTRL